MSPNGPSGSQLDQLVAFARTLDFILPIWSNSLFPRAPNSRLGIELHHAIFNVLRCTDADPEM